MVDDIIDRKILLGKTAPEVEDLLGQPNYKETYAYGYKVVTIWRCHFWECSMDVVFDKTSNKVTSVAVSD